MAKKYVVIDIGCIECREETEVLGIYETESEAKSKHEIGDYFEGGQHSIEVLEAEV